MKELKSFSRYFRLLWNVLVDPRRTSSRLAPAKVLIYPFTTKLYKRDRTNSPRLSQKYFWKTESIFRVLFLDAPKYE